MLQISVQAKKFNEFQSAQKTGKWIQNAHGKNSTIAPGRIIGCAMRVHTALAQAINYLEACNMKTGLLINFGSKSLTFKRLINKKHKP